MDSKNIRNFAIIAHIDHGKSTLADRFLELTNTVKKDKIGQQYLDQSKISKERGITIKLAPVRMNYSLSGQEYILNLIDTPGHVDFSYEVSRTLAACEGAVLLVDATQGVQAQTVAHYHTALQENLTLVPVINKIDMPNAQTQTVAQEIEDMFGFKKSEILFISAKTGENVPLLLKTIIQRIPSPSGGKEKPLRALIFDAVYDEYRGVIAYVRIVDGSVKIGDSIQFFQNNVTSTVTDVGYFYPFLASSKILTAGEIGYLISGVKDIRTARVGDTIQQIHSSITPLPGYTTPKSMVFFGVYPKSTDDLVKLKESLIKLVLNDTSLTYTDEYSTYLGSGYRVGFLGLLHAEIIKQRLQEEFGLDLLFTMPQVLYKQEADGPMLEPYMKLSVYAPSQYVGGVMNVCQKRKGRLLNLSYHQTYAVVDFELPYTMFLRGLAGEIKSVSSGFASLDYELIEYRPADLVKLEMLINGVSVDVLSELVYKDEAYHIAAEKARALKEALTRQQFRQIIQGVVNGVIVAREEIPPFRKDVLAKMSGGDRTRKDKLLDKQKKGKSRMNVTGKIILPQEALFSLIQR